MPKILEYQDVSTIKKHVSEKYLKDGIRGLEGWLGDQDKCLL